MKWAKEQGVHKVHIKYIKKIYKMQYLAQDDRSCSLLLITKKGIMSNFIITITITAESSLYQINFHPKLVHSLPHQFYSTMAMYLVNVLSLTLNTILYWNRTVNISQYICLQHGHRNTMNWGMRHYYMLMPKMKKLGYWESKCFD